MYGISRRRGAPPASCAAVSVSSGISGCGAFMAAWRSGHPVLDWNRPCRASSASGYAGFWPAIHARKPQATWVRADPTCVNRNRTAVQHRRPATGASPHGLPVARCHNLPLTSKNIHGDPLMRTAKALAAALVIASAGAQAQTEIQFWHSMGGPLGDWVNALAKEFNAGQKDYRIVPSYKGTYDESMTAAIAAFRAGNAPHVLQVFEVGTATMMASKGAIQPVGEVMKNAGTGFDAGAYVPAVAGYYTASNGQMLSFPFNSSTTVFYYNKDAFKAAGLDPDKAPGSWPEVVAAAAKLKAAGHKCPFTTSWVSWTQLESFSAWHNVEYATRNNGFGGLDTRLAFNTPLHVRHIENLANMARQGLFVYRGRGNAADSTFVSRECAMMTR